jgi:uncharacterized SAM-binding protein YcdF (DUF218 family)
VWFPKTGYVTVWKRNNTDIISAVKRKHRIKVIALLTFVLLAIAAIAFHRQILTFAGGLLVSDDKLEKSDAILVLSGEDGDGTRARTGAELYLQGWAKKLVLSGARSSFNHYETDFAGPVALAMGVPQKDLMILTHRARSTLEEGRIVVPEMERAGIHSIILVTSSYHTRRAKRYLKQVCGDRLRVITHPVDSDWFAPDNWWTTREGRKYFLNESTKAITAYIESP